MRLAVIAAALLFVALTGYYFLYSADGSVIARVQIIGTWQSTDDPKFTREFKSDGKVIDAYDGAVKESALSWTIFTSSMPVDGFSGEFEEGAVYLSIATLRKDELHFKIEQIDANNLVLIYLDRGGTLSFTKLR